MSLIVRGVELGAGRPAVIVPLTGTDVAELRAQAGAVRAAAPDVVEWRVDLATALQGDLDALAAAGHQVTDALDGLPLLVTLRTREQGGAADVGGEEYLEVLGTLVGAGVADLVDVELSLPAPTRAGAIGLAHDAGVAVVVSHHDWQGTPPRKELRGLLDDMVAAGADVAKLAVTPRDPDDLLALLRATREVSERAGVPVIAVAMGDLGAVVRLAGGVFGSAATFATVGAGSAPGQLDLDIVTAVLDVLHGEAGPRGSGRHA
ncbi:type I 3-dehydroquinate dehydratase [Actinotalea sp. M2MS4P-6]|uniref:type I 3-dehydroquinate dehydratase n=1 Tax=Actinotalea sp. M2MS4P-6 TaxID=2983762 RepID=UPI0021E47B7A|nr:type I 3-dehydroquinate dehydratase [Actinotalea sp. M2MS4P-6]MCV2396363.1 type I 3-dehydroquinate dehydratase [Actinotalea sp. M2MS4P-6]